MEESISLGGSSRSMPGLLFAFVGKNRVRRRRRLVSLCCSKRVGSDKRNPELAEYKAALHIRTYL